MTKPVKKRTSKRMHWGGGLQLPKMRYLAGWPCCCSGLAAMKAKEEGLITGVPKEVTCKKCLSNMEKAGLFEEIGENGGRQDQDRALH